MNHNKIKLTTYTQNYLYDNIYNEICGLKFGHNDLTIIKTSDLEDVNLHNRFYTIISNNLIYKYSDTILHDIRQYILNMKGCVELFNHYYSKNIKPPFLIKYEKNRKQIVSPGFFILVTYTDKETNEDFYKIGYIDYSEIGYYLDIRFLNSEFSKTNIKTILVSNIDSDNNSFTVELRKKLFTDEDIFNDKLSLILRQKSSMFYLLNKLEIDNDKFIVNGLYFSFNADKQDKSKSDFYYDEIYDESGSYLSHILCNMFLCKHITTFV